MTKSCPKCGATSATQAEGACKPEGDSCPMTGHDDWDEALENAGVASSDADSDAPRKRAAGVSHFIVDPSRPRRPR